MSHFFHLPEENSVCLADTCMCSRVLQHGLVSRPLDVDDIHLSKDSLEVLCLGIAISPGILETLQNSQDWRYFITDILLLTKNRLIRVCALDQLFYIITKCNTNTSVLVAFISLLFSAIEVGLYAREHLCC